MKKGSVAVKDFGKVTIDTENWDESLKAYICAIFDVYANKFPTIDVKTEDKKEFTEMIYHDIEGRIKGFFGERILKRFFDEE